MIIFRSYGVNVLEKAKKTKTKGKMVFANTYFGRYSCIINGGDKSNINRNARKRMERKMIQQIRNIMLHFLGFEKKECFLCVQYG